MLSRLTGRPYQRYSHGRCNPKQPIYSDRDLALGLYTDRPELQPNNGATRRSLSLNALTASRSPPVKQATRLLSNRCPQSEQQSAGYEAEIISQVSARESSYAYSRLEHAHANARTIHENLAMGQGAGRPTTPPLLTVTFEDGLGQATAGSFLHGLACLTTAVPLEDTPVLRCKVEALCP